MSDVCMAILARWDAATEATSQIGSLAALLALLPTYTIAPYLEETRQEIVRHQGETSQVPTSALLGIGCINPVGVTSHVCAMRIGPIFATTQTETRGFRNLSENPRIWLLAAGEAGSQLDP